MELLGNPGVNAILLLSLLLVAIRVDANLQQALANGLLPTHHE